MACSQTLTPRHGHSVWRKIDLSVSLYLHLVVMRLILIRSWSDQSPGISTSKGQVHQSKNVESCLTCLVWTRLDQLCPRYKPRVFMAFNQTLTPRHGHTVWRKIYLSVSLYVHVVVMTLILIRSWSDESPGTSMGEMWNMAKMATKCKMARFLLRFS